MGTLRGESDARNPFAEAFARIAIQALEILAADQEAVATLRALIATPTEIAPEKATGLSKKELAAAIGKSIATIDRFDREGAPLTYCGDTKRYELASYRAWLERRGKKPTKSKLSKRVDVSDIADAAGLRGAR